MAYERNFHAFRKQWGVIPDILWSTYAAKAYTSTGNSFTVSLRVYHPLTILLLICLIIFIIPMCLFTPQTVQQSLLQIWYGCTVEKWYKDNPDHLHYVTHKEYRRMLKWVGTH